MAHEAGSKGHVTRYMFTCRLADRVIGELRSFDTGEQKCCTSRTVRGVLEDSTSIDEGLAARFTLLGRPKSPSYCNAFEVGVTNKELEEFLMLKEAMDEAQCGWRVWCKLMVVQQHQITQIMVGWQHQAVRHIIHIDDLCRLLKHPIRIYCDNCMCTITGKKDDHDGLVIRMFNYYLTRQDLMSMKPRAWTCNTVFMLAPKVFMAHEVGSKGHVTRYMFTCRLVDIVIEEL
ncbi:hypothetical protein SESBI_43716 [Sesbania bispinosa]|nr:hypothetical protein SESBI_43716 [Sesbania bispinosa]